MKTLSETLEHARSQLADPGHHPDQPAKAVGSTADAIMLDLDDTVVPDNSSAWRSSIGDHVVVNPAYVDNQATSTRADGMTAERQLAWYFGTHLGALTQFIPNAAHLTREGAECTPCMWLPPTGGRIQSFLISQRQVLP